jgi:hypothetical protein
MLDEQTYYKYMSSFSTKLSFRVIHYRWHECFTYILRSLKVGYTQRVIDSLFYGWEMSNWKAMWKENSEYAFSDAADIRESFCDECHYVCDRASYDRLFRTHWLFRKGWKAGFAKILENR